jgi:hypothetical protein
MLCVRNLATESYIPLLLTDPWIGADQAANVTDYNKRSGIIRFAGQGSGDEGEFEVFD